MDWINIIFFILTIPVSILANLLTPLFRNWFALRSNKRATKRLQQLERELRNLKRGVQRDDILFSFTVVLLILGLFAISGIFYLSSIVLTSISENAKEWLRFFSLHTLSGVIGAIFVAVRSIIRQLSANYERKVEKNIASLKAKLESKELPQNISSSQEQI